MPKPNVIPKIKLACLVGSELGGIATIKRELGDVAAVQIFDRHTAILRDLLDSDLYRGGQEISSSNGCSSVVFDNTSDAIQFARELHQQVRLIGRQFKRTLLQKTGIHAGEVLVGQSDGDPLSHVRQGQLMEIMQGLLSIAEPGQILVTRFVYESSRQFLKADDLGEGAATWRACGVYEVEGADDLIEIGEVAGNPDEPLPRLSDSKRARKVRSVLELPEIQLDLSEKPLLHRFRSASRPEWNAVLRGAIFISFVGLIALVFRWFDARSYDLGYLFKGDEIIDNVVIIEMDDDSYTELGQNSEGLWDRSLHARLIERLTRAGAKVVAFDVALIAPIETNDAKFVTDRDRDLRRAMETHGRVVLAASVDHSPDGSKTTLPSPFFRDIARWGFVEKTSGSTLAIRECIKGERIADNIHTSFVHEIAIAAKLMPASPPAKPWLRYYGIPKLKLRGDRPGPIRSFSYKDALSTDNVPDRFFTNKVVFIGQGVTTGQGIDQFQTPYSLWRPPAPINGVEVQATSFLNLTRGDGLRRLQGITESLLVVLIGSTITLVLFFLEPSRAIIVGLMSSALISLVCPWQVWATGIWFPWLIPAVLQIPTAITWSIAFRTRIEKRQKHALRKAVEALRSTHTTTLSQQPVSQSSDSNRASGSTGGGASPGPNLPDDQISRQTMRVDTSHMVDHQPQVPDHRMIRCIGRGGYGEVWVATDAIDQPKAVKIITRFPYSNSSAFEREFKGLQKYSPISNEHPNLVNILHIGRNNTAGFIYYIMEAGDDILTGAKIDPQTYKPRNLGTDIERRGGLPLAEVLRVGIDLAEALSFLHKHSLVHRDVKPQNVIFIKGRPKLADIGLVTEIAKPGMEVSHIGTFGFLPPEGPGEPSADVYALGKTLYFALTGKSVTEPPWPPEPGQHGLNSTIADKLFRCLLRAIEPRKEDRYPNASAFASDLRELLERMN